MIFTIPHAKEKFRQYFKVSILIFALFAVSQLYHRLKSREFRKYLMNMTLEVPVMDWCPQGEIKLQFAEGDRQITELDKIGDFCLVTNEPVDKESLDKAQFQPWISAVSQDGKQILLEADHRLKVYKTQGLPFKSQVLDKQTQFL